MICLAQKRTGPSGSVVAGGLCDILRSGTERQTHAYDDLEESMGLILRGKERVENKSLGGRTNVYTQDPEALLHACQTRGSDCRRVPFDDITKPWNQRRKPGFRRLTDLGRSEATGSTRRLCPGGVVPRQK